MGRNTGMQTGISKSEIGWVDFEDKNGVVRYTITSKASAPYEMFFLYELQGDKFVKIGKGANPLELEKRFNVMERMQNNEV